MSATFGGRVGALAEPGLRAANRVLHLAIVATLLEGARRRDPRVTVNGIASLGFAALPSHIESRYGARVRPWQRTWVSAAALIHALGTLGPYDRIDWWDRLAHALSGVVVAAAADVAIQAAAMDGRRAPVSPRLRSTFVAGVTLGLGVLWELLEYGIHATADRTGIQPLLVHYGRLDAVGDVVFDLLGAALVILFGRRTLADVAESIADG